MRSSSAGLARPVRTVANSWWVDSTDFAMRSCASSSSPSISSSAMLALSFGCRYQRAHAHPGDYPRDARLVVHVEDIQRHPVLHAQRERGGIHHAQAALERFHVGEL